MCILISSFLSECSVSSSQQTTSPNRCIFIRLLSWWLSKNKEIDKQMIYLSFPYLSLRDFFCCCTFNSQTIQMFSSKIYHTLVRCARFDGLLFCFFAICQWRHNDSLPHSACLRTGFFQPSHTKCFERLLSHCFIAIPIPVVGHIETLQISQSRDFLCA